MRTDLDHLSIAKKQEIRQVLRILFAEFEDALAGRNAWTIGDPPLTLSGRSLSF